MEGLDRGFHNRPLGISHPLPSTLYEQLPIREDPHDHEREQDTAVLCGASPKAPYRTIVDDACNNGDHQSRRCGGMRREFAELRLPDIQLPEDYARLSALWDSESLRHVVNYQRSYFRHGMYGVKRELASTLDPIHRGIVSPRRADALLAV
jgi:hypothetical protein